MFSNASSVPLRSAPSESSFDCGQKGPEHPLFWKKPRLFGAADGAETRTDAGHRAQLHESMFREVDKTGFSWWL
jgi:hypothetical protein